MICSMYPFQSLWHLQMGQAHSDPRLRLPKALKRKRTLRKKEIPAFQPVYFQATNCATERDSPTSPPFNTFTRRFDSSESSCTSSSYCSTPISTGEEEEKAPVPRKVAVHPYARKQPKAKQGRMRKRPASVYSSKWEPPQKSQTVSEPAVASQIKIGTSESEMISSTDTLLLEANTPTPKVSIGFSHIPDLEVRLERFSLASCIPYPLNNPYSVPKTSLLTEGFKALTPLTTPEEFKELPSVPESTGHATDSLQTTQPTPFQATFDSSNLANFSPSSDIDSELPPLSIPSIEPTIKQNAKEKLLKTMIMRPISTGVISQVASVLPTPIERPSLDSNMTVENISLASAKQHNRIASLNNVARRPLPPTPPKKRAVSTPLNAKDAFSAYQEWSSSGTGPLKAILPGLSISAGSSSQLAYFVSTPKGQHYLPISKEADSVSLDHKLATLPTIDFSFTSLFHTLELKEFPPSPLLSPHQQKEPIIEPAKEDDDEERSITKSARLCPDQCGSVEQAGQTTAKDPVFSVKSNVVVNLPVPFTPTRSSSRIPGQALEEGKSNLPPGDQTSFFDTTPEEAVKARRRSPRKERSREIQRQQSDSAQTIDEMVMQSRSSTLQMTKRGYSAIEITDWLASAINQD